MKPMQLLVQLPAVVQRAYQFQIACSDRVSGELLLDCLHEFGPELHGRQPPDAVRQSCHPDSDRKFVCVARKVQVSCPRLPITRDLIERAGNRRRMPLSLGERSDVFLDAVEE